MHLRNFLGHGNISMTLQYAYLAQDQTRDVVVKPISLAAL